MFLTNDYTSKTARFQVLFENNLPNPQKFPAAARSAPKKSAGGGQSRRDFFTTGDLCGTISVSYTHLDVYKRQGVRFMARFRMLP